MPPWNAVNEEKYNKSERIETEPNERKKCKPHFQADPVRTSGVGTFRERDLPSQCGMAST
jgi:hypothetical protein